ncbi:MAG: tripartite tricarboxylate transporter TctB family protein, partial [Burkholderiales bacterium]
VLFSGYRSAPRLEANTAFYLFLLALLGVMMFYAAGWRLNAKLVPLIVGGISLFMLAASFLNFTFREPRARDPGETPQARSAPTDLAAAADGLDRRTVAKRAWVFLGWLLAYLALTGLIGMLPATFAFIVLYMRIEGRERWGLMLGSAAGVTLVCYLVFDRLLHLAWPRALVRLLFPDMQEFVPSL